MADEPNAAGGAAAPTAPPAYKAELAALLAAEKAEIDAEDAKDTPAEKKPADAEVPAKDDAESKDDAEDEAEDEATDEDAEAEAEEGEGDEEPDGKSKYSKALRKLQKDEASLQQFKTQVLAKEKTVVEREQRAVTAERELRDFISAVKLDPVHTLIKAGLISEDEIGHIARQLHFLSPEALKDPRSRPEAERLRRERERELESKRVGSEVEKMRREREQERAQAQQDAQLDGYISKLDATAQASKAKHPVLAQALEKDAARTERELRAVAHELAVAKQGFADPALVVLAWLKQRKQVLAAHGIAEAAVVPNKAKSTKPAEQKGATDAAKKAATAPPPDNDEDKPGTPAYQRKLKAMLGHDV